MKRSLVNQNHSKKQTGNTLHDIVEQSIDNETRMVIEYFEAHNIPYHMVNGFAIRDDDTELQKQKFVNMTCTKCNKTDDMPYDIYMEMLDMQDLYEKSEYLKIKCIYCNKGTMIPTSHLKK